MLVKKAKFSYLIISLHIIMWELAADNQGRASTVSKESCSTFQPLSNDKLPKYYYF